MTTLDSHIAPESFSILRFHAQLVVHDALRQLDELDSLRVDLVDEAIAFKERDGRLYVDLARVALTTQVELDHGDGQELRVASSVDRHGNLGLL